MRKLLSVLLMVCLLIAPVHAEEIVDQPLEREVDQKANCVIVGSLDELQAAISAANDGDTIAISRPIAVDGDCNIGMPNKRITLTLDCGGTALTIQNGDVNLSMIDFDGQGKSSAIIIGNSSISINKCNFNQLQCALYFGYDVTVRINDCTFTDNDAPLTSGYPVCLAAQNCKFERNHGEIVCISLSGTVDFKNCIFEENYTTGMDGGVLQLYNGIHTVTRCSFIDNKTSKAKGAAIFNSGELTISDCLFVGNQSGVAGDDIFNFGGGTITIVNTDQQLQYLYDSSGIVFDGTFEDGALSEDEFCGMDDPINGGVGIAHVTGRFVDCDSSTRMLLPVENYTGSIHFETHIAPEDQQPNKDNPDERQSDVPSQNENTSPSKQEPAQPPQNGGEDNPDDSLLQVQEQPIEPTQGDNADDHPDTAPDTSDIAPGTVADTSQNTPQKPADNSNSMSNDVTPSVTSFPPQRPTRPATVATASMPEESTMGTSAEPAVTLSCGVAVIDYSRSIKLQGYGDGLSHEDDPLARTQMAAMIFRLLDDQSVIALASPFSSFVDVDADAWYTPYVLALADAGVISGVGNGFYAPNTMVTWAQLLTVLVRFVDSQEYPLQHIQYDGWAKPAIETAVALGWIEDNDEVEPDSLITRGEAVNLLNMVLAAYR